MEYRTSIVLVQYHITDTKTTSFSLVALIFTQIQTSLQSIGSNNAFYKD